ncbi:hypothetical protein ACFV4N_37500 [Actinosynnema sp. NPDC059797]
MALLGAATGPSACTPFGHLTPDQAARALDQHLDLVLEPHGGDRWPNHPPAT